MYQPDHPRDGVTFSGTLTVTPRIGGEGIELLTAIATTSLRAAINDKPSTLVDTLAPDHPDGPNPWIACPDGCCLELNEYLWVRLESVEPWLRYVVQTTLADHAIEGTIMMFDHASRTFDALSVDGTRVRRERVLERRGGKARVAKGRRSQAALRSVESV